MKILITGGSIGGLSAGIALQNKGFEVDIFERSSAQMQGRGAGLVVQPDMMNYLIEQEITPKHSFGVPATERQVLDSTGKPLHRFDNDTTFTSWNYLWKQLKIYFPSEHYHYGHELVDITQDADLVNVTFKNGVTKTADLVIGADGYDSAVRKHFLPNIKPQYAGYIAYRGLIPESILLSAEIDFFDHNFTIYPYENSHILCYMVPGSDDELDKGNRQFNWVWYVNKTNAQLADVVTDKNGKQRDYAVPPGLLSQESTEILHELADKELPEILRDRVHQTEQPFVQVIVDMAVQTMFDNRVVIVGDAASVVRPHTASGTAKAHRDAITLVDNLTSVQDLSTALQRWDDEQIQATKFLIQHGSNLALRSGLGRK